MNTLFAITLIFLSCLAQASAARDLRVCADPNNLPFSNEKLEGFENKLVDIIAEEMDADVEYTWWAQRRGYSRNTLNAGKCDLWPGVASTLERLATTRPYYRSTYVFVTRADRNLDIESFDDPQLKQLTIGVQLIGDDGANTPPAHALARRGIIENVRGYMLYGDYKKPNPPSEIIKAVARGDIDVAVAWGPLAGYFAKKSNTALVVTPVKPWLDGPRWPMVFDISMGVKKGNNMLKSKIDGILENRRDDIHSLLQEYGVPIFEGN